MGGGKDLGKLDVERCRCGQDPLFTWAGSSVVLSRNSARRIWRQKAASKVSFTSSPLDVLFGVVPVASACTEGRVASDGQGFVTVCYIALALIS